MFSPAEGQFCLLCKALSFGPNSGSRQNSVWFNPHPKQLTAQSYLSGVTVAHLSDALSLV